MGPTIRAHTQLTTELSLLLLILFLKEKGEASASPSMRNSYSKLLRQRFDVYVELKRSRLLNSQQELKIN